MSTPSNLSAERFSEISHMSRTQATSGKGTKSTESSSVTAVALLVTAFFIGGFLAGLGGALLFTGFTLLGITIVCLATDDDCLLATAHINDTYHRTHHLPPRHSVHVHAWDWSPLSLFDFNPPSTPAYRQAPQRAEGTHFGRGHMRAQEEPRPAEGRHFGRGHLNR